MDVEKFIDCVKKYPILYNTRHQDYKNIQMKVHIWEEIAREMGVEDSSDVLRIKWKGLKDGYTKYKKQLLGIGGFPKCYNNWIWGPHLEFLEEFSKPRKSLIEKYLRTQSASLSRMQSADVPALALELQSEINQQQSQSDPLKIRGESTTTDDEEKANKPPPKKRQKQSDAIDHLFMSYAETFRRFSLSTQAMIKVEMAKLFADAEMQEFNYNQIHQTPNDTLEVSVSVKSEYNL